MAKRHSKKLNSNDSRSSSENVENEVVIQNINELAFQNQNYRSSLLTVPINEQTKTPVKVVPDEGENEAISHLVLEKFWWQRDTPKK